MSDPLTALRDAYQAGEAIQRDNNEYRIGDRKFPADDPTAVIPNPHSASVLILSRLVSIEPRQRRPIFA
jgi:hypothetical protein